MRLLFPTTLSPRAKKRRAVALILFTSLLSCVAWFLANQEPTYPIGEGVYPESAYRERTDLTQPNAAMFYMSASDALDLNKIYASGPNGKHTARFLQDEPIAAQKAFVEQAQPTFALLRQGMKYPYLPDLQTNDFKDSLISAKGVSRPTPNFFRHREIASLLACEANVRAAKGNYNGAMESSLDAIRYGVDQAKGRSLMDGMIGILDQLIGENASLKVVGKLSAPEARIAASRLEATLQTAPTFAEILTQERDRVYGTMQDIFRTGDLSELQRFQIENERKELPLNGMGAHVVYKLAILGYTKQGLVDDYSDYMDQELKRAKMPYYQAKQLPPIPESTNPFVSMITGKYPRANMQTIRITVLERVILADLAVQAYRKEHHNRVPSSLSELTTGARPYLSAVPVDLFSKSGNDSLCYNPRNGDVYSVGENGIDDRYSHDDIRR